MMIAKHEDIDEIINEIQHIKTNLNDPVLGSVFWEEAMKSLIEHKGTLMINLLNELKKRRDEQ